MRIEGNISMPKELEDMISLHKEEIKDIDKNFEYLNELPRKIDLMFLCVFFGLYSSKELPPPEDPDNYKVSNNEIEMGTYRFTVKVDTTANLLRHLLFVLWISKEDITPSDTFEYREKLYGFLERILDDNYIKKVIIPFYLIKAAEKIEEDPSFISKLKKSVDIDYGYSIFSPEMIALEYHSIKRKFENDLKKKLKEKNFLG